MSPSSPRRFRRRVPSPDTSLINGVGGSQAIAFVIGLCKVSWYKHL